MQPDLQSMRILTAFFIFCFLLPASAQQKINRKAQSSYDKAQIALRQLDYDTAVQYLTLATSQQTDFQQAYIQLGDIYRKKGRFKQAIPNYLRAVEISNDFSAQILFSLGESELAIGSYDEALKHLQEYLLASDSNRQLAEKYILDCQFAIQAMANPVAYNPVNMGPAINSQNRDYFPTLTADGALIIFTRQIDGNEDFYMARRVNGNWQNAEPLSRNINTPRFNEGAQSITPDGKYLFFTGCNRPDGLGRCDIFVSRKEGNDWGKPINLGAPLNTNFWESQPAISPDGNTLYFVSNRPGGFGGYDIYKSHVNANGEWSVPENLGANINTPYDENTPFLHPDGKTLYFSSNGWPGMGNKDIFFSRLAENGNWAKPENIGYPINSHNEESGMTVTADGLSAMFSAEHSDGFGSQDIYSFLLPNGAKPNPVTYVKGVVKDRVTGEFLHANVVVKNLATLGLFFDDYTSDENGTFLTVMPLGAEYSFNVTAPGYLFFSEYYQLLKPIDHKPVEIEILLEKIRPGADVTMKNIFFDTNKFEILPNSKIELAVLIDFLTLNPKLKIEIQGHTDNVGDDSLNERLSLNRAIAVREYLIERHIDPNRLTYKGFGKSKPVADNSTPEGQQKNRRTSFIITDI